MGTRPAPFVRFMGINKSNTMNKNGLWLASAWVILIILGSCAKRGTPTGGEKDTIPPVLVRAIPALETVNFDGDEIQLEFDELIEARNLKKELIITPPIKDYDFYTKKNKLYIRLKEDLLDSTTYTFNFGEAIQDLSERNKAENAVIAFSTGAYIDSFQVSGTVRQLLTQAPAEGAVVALYNVKDTLDAFTGPPMYFAKADEEGNYTIRYIKQGQYRIYAYNDVNSNLKAETNKEAYGFKADTLYLRPPRANTAFLSDSLPPIDLAAVNISLVRKNIQPLVLQSSRPNGKYYEFKFNKGIRDYTLSVNEEDVAPSTKDFVAALEVNTTDSTRYLFDNLQNAQKVIRAYNTLQQDSLRVSLTASDSTEQMIRDSVFYVQFVESRRQSEEFQTQFEVQSDAIEQTVESVIRFNKPVIKVKSDSILLSYDTLFYLPIDYKRALTWNNMLDEVRIEIPVSRQQLVDSVLFYKRQNDSVLFARQQQLARTYLDSLQQATDPEKQRALLQSLTQVLPTPSLNILRDSVTNTENNEQATRLIQAYSDTATFDEPPPVKQYDRRSIDEGLEVLNFYAASGSFMSVEQDSSQAIIQRYTFKNPEEYGTVSGTIDLPYKSYFLQLVDKDYKVVKELKDPKRYTFSMIPPDTYRLRILIDANNNDRWEDGNILLNQEPEPVLMYQDEVVFRENWEVNDVNLDSSKLFTQSSE